MTRAARLSRTGDASRPPLHRRSWHGGARGGKGPADLAKAAKKSDALEPGGLGRGRKRKQPLVTHGEAARKRLQGHGGAVCPCPCRVSYDTGEDRAQKSAGTAPSPGAGGSPPRELSAAGPGGARGWLRRRRIHVVAGEAVGVLDDPLLVDVHEDLLAADGADAVGEVLGGHPRGAVELSEGRAERER